MINYTLKQLYAFEATIRLGSFTKAAKELSLTQPAVYTQVQQIQENIGLSLFDMSGKKIQSTFIGQKLYQTAVQVINTLEASKLEIEQNINPNTGHLEIAVATTANSFISRILANFKQQYPQISFHLEVTNRQFLLDKLSNKKIDLVIMGEPPQDSALIAQNFMKNPLIVIAHPNHPWLKNNKKHSIQDLEKQTLITREASSGTRITIERITRVNFNSDIEINSNEAIIEAVQAGLGIGFVSEHSVQLELQSGAIKVLNVEKFPIIRHWHIVHHADKQLSPIAKQFKAFVITNCS